MAGSGTLENDPHVVALAGGGFVVVWRNDFSDGTGDPGIQATVYDNNGVVVNNFIHVNTTTAGDQKKPEVAALADGGFVVVWDDDGLLIRGQRFDANGSKVGNEFTENFSVEDNPVVAALSDGRFIVGFEDVDNAPGDIDIHGTIFDPRTSPINGDGNANVITSRKEGATVNGLGGADTLLGQEGVDILNGGGGNDYLSGGASADFMMGGTGNDTYIVDNAGDVADETGGDGTDLVKSSVSFVLGAGIENLELTGSGAINGTGNGLANTLTGNAKANGLNGGGGADMLDGKAGADTMRGNAGNDTYIVDNAGDKAIENAGQGTDTVKSSVSFVLGSNVENLTADRLGQHRRRPATVSPIR